MKVNTNNSKNISNTDKITNENQNIITTSGDPRAKVTDIDNQEINYPLYSRELANDESESDDYGYSEEVVKAIKILSLKSISLNIEFIHKFIDSEYSIEFDETNSPAELALVMSEVLTKIPPQYHKQLSKYMDEIVTPQALEILTEKCENNEIGVDACHNGNICWNILEVIFKKYREYDNDRNLLNKFTFIQTSTDILVPNIDPIISTAILKLETLKEEKYFSIFRTLIDINQTLEDKYLKVQKYFDLIPFNEDTSNLSLANEIYHYAFEYIQNMSCYVTSLQILIEGLTVLKKAPKTIENTKILLAICTSTLNCYEEEKDLYGTMQKDSRKNGQEVCQMIRDYFFIMSHIKGLQQQLTKVIDNATPRKQNNDDWSTATTRPFLQNKNKQKQSKNKSKKHQHQKSLGTTKTNSQTIASNEVKEEKIQIDIIVNKQEDTQPEVFPIIVEEKAVTLNSILFDISSENDSFSDIERETNAYMEIFRQIIERNRREKLQLKEEKLKKSSFTKNSIIINNNTNITNPEIIKLSNKHQETLIELFKEKPGHLILLGTDIESLIKILNGRVEGCGNGSKFKIFWNNSNKLAGTYEVTHGFDLKGYLTSDYAIRVASAIKSGIQWGCIAKETMKNIDLVITFSEK